jgi:hypothetical protein
MKTAKGGALKSYLAHASTSPFTGPINDFWTDTSLKVAEHANAPADIESLRE